MGPVDGRHNGHDRAQRDAMVDLRELVALIRLLSCSAPAQPRAACSEGCPGHTGGVPATCQDCLLDRNVQE